MSVHEVEMAMLLCLIACFAYTTNEMSDNTIVNQTPTNCRIMSKCWIALSGITRLICKSCSDSDIKIYKHNSDESIKDDDESSDLTFLSLTIL
jgi:hypothetical protein